MSGDIELVTKYTQSFKTLTKKQVAAVHKALGRLADSVAEDDQIIKLITEFFGIRDSDQAEGERLILSHLTKPENRPMAARNLGLVVQGFFDTVSYVDQDERTNFTNDLDMAEAYLRFIETLVDENPETMVPLLQQKLNDMATKFNLPTDVIASALGELINRYFAGFDTAYTENPRYIEAVGPQGEYFRVLLAELEKPVRGTSVADFLKVEHDESALLAKNAQLKRDMRYFTAASGTEFGALRPVIFQYRFLNYLVGRYPTLDRLSLLKVIDSRREGLKVRLNNNIELKLSRLIAALRSQDEDQIALVQKIATDNGFKRMLFNAAPMANELKNPQRWLTVQDPGKLIAEVSAKIDDAPKIKAQFSKALKQHFGIGWPQILADPEYLRFYADDVADILRGVELPDESAVNLRFISRQFSELRLGDKCGDCTSVGSVNFGPSTTWFYNPGYQILTFSKGKRFLGKMNLALWDVNGKPSILIDALEFNPQALNGKPYHLDAQEGLKRALQFARDLATSEGRALHALVRSNSSGANEVLRSEAIDEKLLGVSDVHFAYDESAVRKALDLTASIAVRPYYQVLDRGEGLNPAVKGVQTATDPRLALFESNFINPVQQSDPEFARELIESVNADTEEKQMAYLRQASERLLADPDIVAGIQKNVQLSSERTAELEIHRLTA